MASPYIQNPHVMGTAHKDSLCHGHITKKTLVHDFMWEYHSIHIFVEKTEKMRLTCLTSCNILKHDMPY